MAGKRHIKTQRPWIVNVIKNHENDCLILINLTSCPVLFTLKNKKELNLKAHNEINTTNSKEVISNLYTWDLTK